MSDNSVGRVWPLSQGEASAVQRRSEYLTAPVDLLSSCDKDSQQHCLRPAFVITAHVRLKTADRHVVERTRGAEQDERSTKCLWRLCSPRAAFSSKRV